MIRLRASAPPTAQRGVRLRGFRFGVAAFVAAASHAAWPRRIALAAWPSHQPVARLAAERNRLRGVPFMAVRTPFARVGSLAAPVPL